MTRPLPRRLLALALASAILAAPVVPALAEAFAPFAVSDIRVDGLQRISAGTVFTYLPIERGDTVDSVRVSDAIRALYKTGFFDDVRVDRQGEILVVSVVERPAINKLTISGNKDIKTEDLTKGLSDIGLSEGNTFDRLALDRVTQELTRQYNNRGKYNVEITPTVAKLDRNRVDVTINVKEGTAAKISHINLIGNEKFKEKDIRDTWESRESNWRSFYKRDDQYSREKLSGDLEKLNSYYLDRGYVDFSVDSTQVAISPDRSKMFITAGLTEGDQYKVSKVEVTGDTILPKADLEKRVLIKPGQIFSRRLLEVTSDSITASLANIGYAFAQVNAVPDLDREAKTVGINLQVVPGPRVNVRRVIFKGNAKTSDEVLRREMRQFEGSWYSQAALDRSKIRLQGLGFFESVDMDPQPVAGTNDQVDVEVAVKETTSGSFVFGLGFSQLSGLTTQVQLSQNNFLGTGNRISLQANRNSYLQRYDFSFVNPYFTDSGVSLGYNLWYRQFDNSNFNTAQYSSDSGAAQMVLGVPITETDSFTALLGIDTNTVYAFEGSTPQPLVDYIDAVGHRTFHTWRGQVGWQRNTLDNFLTPNTGTLQHFNAEVALPGSTVEYFKLTYDISKFWRLSRYLVLNTRANLGYGDSYGSPFSRDVCQMPLPPIFHPPGLPADDHSQDVQPPRPPATDPCTTSAPDYRRTITADGLPFFENFYAGGVRSVRGFTDNTLGPRVSAAGSSFEQPVGGALKTTGSVEMFFPTLLKSPGTRISAFVDVGNVFADRQGFDANKLKASAGVALMWRSPLGPITISYAQPFRTEPTDRLERLQFTFGGVF